VAVPCYGSSQPRGAEGRPRVEMGGQGVGLPISDPAGGQERERIMVQADDLLAALTAPPAGGSTVEGISPPQGAKMLLDLEVRRNEVLLRARRGAEGGWDVAVGLDDFQDALEKVIRGCQGTPRRPLMATTAAAHVAGRRAAPSPSPGKGPCAGGEGPTSQPAPAGLPSRTATPGSEARAHAGHGH